MYHILRFANIDCDQWPIRGANISHQLQRLGPVLFGFSSGDAALADSKSNSDFGLRHFGCSNQWPWNIYNCSQIPNSISARSSHRSLAPPSSSPWSRRCRRLGVTKYVYKPFNPDQFLAQIIPAPVHYIKPMMISTIAFVSWSWMTTLTLENWWPRS